MPFLIDDMKDTANRSYDGWPDRLFVIDVNGTIAYRGAPGPKGFKVDEAEGALRNLLSPPAKGDGKGPSKK